MDKKIAYAILALVCIGSILLAAPIINRNVDDPNLIAYFDHDNANFMSLTWYYYTGEKIDSFQFEGGDYGLALLYLSDFAKVVLSKFMQITPGIFVFLIRGLNLIFWIASILVLWKLVRFHFGTYWQPLLAVLFLAFNPAFSYLSQGMKPDPIVLFLMIIGLDYSLRIIKDPSWKNLALACACASLAAVIKYAGIFLLLPILAGMYFSGLHNEGKRKVYGTLKIAWALPALIGIIFIGLPAVLLLFYVRQSTGFTWHEEFGFLNSVLRNPLILVSFVIGMLFIILSFAAWALNQSKKARVKEIMHKINTLLSHCTIVFLFFTLFFTIFGIRWIIMPRHFITACAVAGPERFVSLEGILSNGLYSFIGYFYASKLKVFGTLIFFLIIACGVIEMKNIRNNIAQHKLHFFKRIMLFIFTIQVVPCIFSTLAFRGYHMIPFFAVGIIFITEELKELFNTANTKIYLKHFAIGLISAFLAISFGQNVIATSRSFVYMYHWRDDVVFDVIKWWRENYPPDTSIVADNPTRVYLPPEYKNAKFVKFQKDTVEQLRDLVASFKPELVYYNTGVSRLSKLPPVEDILPDTKVQLIASFDNADRHYKKHPESKYVIYKIIYD
jgi:hypothetical protein